MEYVQGVIDNIIANFDFAYMLIVNILTYGVIKLIDYLNKDKNVSTLIKRIILVSCIAIVTIIYILTGYKEYKILVNSAIAAPVFYSWLLRPILKKFKIGYKEFDKTLN